MTNKNYILPSNCDFSEVKNVNTSEFDCSPKLTGPFEGLLINAPSHIVWPNNVSLEEFPVSAFPFGITKGPLRLMLAGYADLKKPTHALLGAVDKYVLVVAVNQATGKPYLGRMPRTNYLQDPSPKPTDEEEGFHLHPEIFGVSPEPSVRSKEEEPSQPSHFNFDLVYDLNLPITNATYHVYACLAGFTSNVLTIHTSVAK